MQKRDKFSESFEALPNEFKKPSFCFQDHFEVKRLQTPSPSPLYFLWARTSSSYQEESMESLNKSPYNLQIFKEVKDENPENLFLLVEYLPRARNLLQVYEKPLTYLEIANLSYQLLDVFLKKTSDFGVFILPFHFYLHGSRLKTEIFISLSRKNMSHIKVEEYFLEGKGKDSEKKEIIALYFIGVVMFKLLTRNKEFSQEKDWMKEVNGLKNPEAPKELIAVMERLLKKAISGKTTSLAMELNDCKDELRKFYKSHYLHFFALSPSKGSELRTGSETRDFTNEIQIFLLTLPCKLRDEDLIFVNLVLAYITLFLRKLIVKVLAYQDDYTLEQDKWIEAVDAENLKLEERFLIYYDIAEGLYQEKAIGSQLFEGLWAIKPDFSCNLLEMQRFFQKHYEKLEAKLRNIEGSRDLLAKLADFLRVDIQRE